MKRGVALSEDTRQLVHIAFGACAMLLRWLTWFEATMLAAMAVAFNLFALHRLGGARLFRPDERGRYRVKSGIVLYPASVVGLLLLLPERLDIVAGAWGVLAAGDGTATLVGRRAPIRPLPWNPDKSLGGMLAFMIFGGAAAVALLWWCRETVIPPAFWWYPAVAGVLGAVAAAAVETIPISLRRQCERRRNRCSGHVDRVSCQRGSRRGRSSGGGSGASHGNRGECRRRRSGLPCTDRLGLGRDRSARCWESPSSWPPGGRVGRCCLRRSAPQPLRRDSDYAASRLSASKRRVEGRRGAANAVANTGVATVAAILSVLSYGHDWALVGFVAALTAGGSDTVASEIGKAWGDERFWSQRDGRSAAGTPGQCRFEGTLAGVAAAFMLASLAASLDLIGWDALLPVVAGATAGALLESFLGASLEPAGVVNNDVLNFINTAAAAYIAIRLWGFS